MRRRLCAALTGLALFCAGGSAASAGEHGPAGQEAEMRRSSATPAIGRVHPGNGAYCTGVLVAENVAVTAAHCLVNQRTKRWVRAESLHFLGGYDAGEYNFHARVARYTVNPGYDPGEPTKNLHRDWAVLVLSGPATGATPVRLAADRVPEAMARVSGYAIQRKYALSTTSPCKVELKVGMFFGRCKATRGMSGAPLIDVASGDMIAMQVAAVHRDDGEILVAVPVAAWRDMLDDLR